MGEGRLAWGLVGCRVARSPHGATLHSGLGGEKKRAGQLAVVRLLGGSDLLSHFRSTIGAVRFNFSVRNGKRWNPHAITTLVSFSPLCVRCVKVRSFLEVQNAVSRAVVPLEASSVSLFAPPASLCLLVCEGLASGLRSCRCGAASLPRRYSLSRRCCFRKESCRDISIARLGHRCPYTCNLSTS